MTLFLNIIFSVSTGTAQELMFFLLHPSEAS